MLSLAPENRTAAKLTKDVVFWQRVSPTSELFNHLCTQMCCSNVTVMCDCDDRGIPARAQNPEQLKEAILCKFSDILKAQENSLWALPEWILNDTSTLRSIPKKVSLKENQLDEEQGRETARSTVI